MSTTEYVSGMNVLGELSLLIIGLKHGSLGIIVFCIAVGIVLSQMQEEANAMVQFFVVLDKVIMKLVMTVMWYVLSGRFTRKEPVTGTRPLEFSV